ncbi:hypothetical protein [Bacillus cereus]|uniref:hypothetical protein n=1 Tax=Bacillus cereus TaxID=1396 RepID=UPI000BF93BFD|nr:hypothetical protein [Bacillus cereus]PEQ63868.1 hypothetical protein CN469_13885 [Bacillus cereus]
MKSVKVEVDTKEANENIKELTAVVNECVAALEKLEKVMGRFTDKGEMLIQFDTVLDGRTMPGRINKLTREKFKRNSFE